MAPLNLATIEVPWAGLHTTGAPGRLPAGKAPYLRNFLVHTPGKLMLRGGTSTEAIKTSTASGDEKSILSNAWAFNDRLLLGFHKKSAVSTEGYAPPWRAPYLRLSESKKLAKAANKMVYVNLTAGTATEVTGGEEHLSPGSNGERLEKYVYGFSYDGSEAEEINGGYRWRTKLLRWDGSTTKPTAYSNAPEGGQAVKVHLDRLWVLGGRDKSKPTEFQKVPFKVSITTAAPSHTYISCSDTVSGGLARLEQYFPVGAEVKGSTLAAGTKVVSYGSASSGSHFVWCEGLATENKEGVEVESKSTTPIIELNSLFWTREGGPLKDETVYWTDENSGLTNRIVVGTDDQDDYGVALAVVNQALVVFKRHSIWALYGYSPETFSVRNLTKERGCLDPNSVTEADGGVYFLSQNGLEFFDGSQFNRVDESVSNIVEHYAHIWAEEYSTEILGRCTCEYIGNDYVFVSIAGQRLTENAEGGKGDVAGTESGFGNFIGYVHGPTGNWSLFTTESLGGTGKALSVHRAASTPVIFDSQYVTKIDHLTSEFGERLDHGKETKCIPAKFRTDRVELSSPGYKTQGHRFLLDYLYATASTKADGTPGKTALTAKLLGTNGGTIMSAQTLTDQNAPAYDLLGLEGERLSGRRFVFDEFNEMTDISLVVEYSGDASVAPTLELYSGYMEYATTRQRRSE